MKNVMVFIFSLNVQNYFFRTRTRNFFLATRNLLQFRDSRESGLVVLIPNKLKNGTRFKTVLEWIYVGSIP